MVALDAGATKMTLFTLIVPNIVEAIPCGREPTEMTLAALMRSFAVGRSQ